MLYVSTFLGFYCKNNYEQLKTSYNHDTQKYLGLWNNSRVRRFGQIGMGANSPLGQDHSKPTFTNQSTCLGPVFVVRRPSLPKGVLQNFERGQGV